jgi:gamma-glutamyl-gamma-aminobutyraldehyde dehydrogenase
MRPFQFMVGTRGVIDRRTLVEGARWAESIGCSHLAIHDHLSPQLAPIPVLTAVAMATDRLALCPLVFNNDLRHPAVLAQDLATIDILSEGRLIPRRLARRARPGRSRTRRGAARRHLARVRDTPWHRGHIRRRHPMAVAALPAFRTRAFIDGAFRDAASGETFVTENPATGQPLASIAAGDAADIDAAVAAARRAFDDGRWSNQAPADRKTTLLRFADLLDANLEELALLDSLEAGKPITDCREGDLPETVKTFRWFAEAIDKVFDSVAPTGPEALGLIVREPIGVVGAVLPWNFPILMAAWKAAPALAAGNSLVIKPAELTSLSTIRMAELAVEAGIPDGVLNVVPGLGETAGQALGRHTGVDMLSFTGSTEVGRYFLKYSAESNLKRITLEMGGKSPQVVLADPPDLDRVAEQVLIAGLMNMGENCSCGSRLLVHRSVRDALVDRLVDGLGEWPVGDPQAPATRVGPMIERPHLDKVLGYIEAGRGEGARIVAGGERTLADTGGYFVAPTIFDDVANTMTIAREEIFGPVISLIPFDDEEEAITLANQTSYGLAASVYTTNLDRAIRFSRALKAGTVGVNAYSEGDITTPFGGYKESGFGGRDKGLEAFDQYTEKKTIWFALG